MVILIFMARLCIITRIGYLTFLRVDCGPSHWYGLHLFFGSRVSRHRSGDCSCLLIWGRSWAASCSILLTFFSSPILVSSSPPRPLARSCPPAQYCSDCGIFALSFINGCTTGLRLVIIGPSQWPVWLSTRLVMDFHACLLALPDVVLGTLAHSQRYIDYQFKSISLF